MGRNGEQGRKETAVDTQERHQRVWLEETGTMGLRRNKDEYWKMELVLTRDQLDQLTPDNKRIAGNEQDQIRYWEAGGNNKQFHFLTSPEETSIGFANYTNTNRKGSLLEDLDEMNDDDKSLMSTIHDWDTQDRFFF